MSVLRIVLLALGAVSLLGGLLLVLGGGPEGAVAGIWLVIQGSVVMLAVAFERTRYRSESAERTAAPHGPGGGETADAPMEPRFQPTDEVFVDPTSRRRMRVWLDPVRGERRYRAED